MIFQNGDLRFFWPQNIGDFASLPSAWDSSLNTGLGISQLSSLWITSYFNFTALFTRLGLNWNLIQLIFWILPAILLSFFSSFSLFNYLFKNRSYATLSGFLYLLNTYFLMILTGGQLGVCLSYSLVPLVLFLFIKTLDKPNAKNLILTGIILSLQTLFDPRIVYISLAAVFIYLLFNFQKLNSVKNKISLLVPLGTAILLNFFWIFPLILAKNSPLPSGFDSASSFKFFSFADFSHALSLLHPNWPENIFGKIYFLDPKFLLLPIIAFSSLLFKKDKNIIFFSILALVGIFLAKGANDPFGVINLLLFSKFSGMSMFRDPTKWYVFVAISYSILIPFALLKIATRISNFKFQISNLLYLAFILYFLFLISPIVKQFKFQQVPQGYVRLANFLENQTGYFRTLWIPEWQRFGYFSNNHPAIGREELYKGNAKKQILELNEETLKDLSVKYIIVPDDSNGEIFIKNREYDKLQYQDTVSRLRKISWLKEDFGFGKIKIFELSDPKDHFWSPSKVKVSYQYSNPTNYNVEIRNAKKGDLLVFSEGFDRNWVAESSDFKTNSSKFENLMNSFTLPREGNYSLKIHYQSQNYVNFGMIVSVFSLIGLLVLLRVKFHL